MRGVFASEAAHLVDKALKEAAALQAELAGKRALLRFLRNAAFTTWPESDEAATINRYLAAPLFPAELTGEIKSYRRWRRGCRRARRCSTTPTPRCRRRAEIACARFLQHLARAALALVMAGAAASRRCSVK